MRTLAIAAATLLFAGAAYAQSAIQNPSVPGSGYQAPAPTGTPKPTETMGASKSHEGNPQDMPAAKGQAMPATNNKGDMPKGDKNKN